MVKVKNSLIKAKTVYYILIGVVFSVFIVIMYHYDKYGREKSIRLSFSGTIESIIYLKDEKGMDFKINNSWYRLEYNPDFEKIKYVGCKIVKKSNEQGVWIESKMKTGHFIYYEVYSGLIKDRQYIKRLNNLEMEKK
jgi:hypothetical protein